MTKSVALEQATANIRINAVCPGGIETDMIDRIFGTDKLQFVNQHPVGRLGTPEEIANIVLWLCSDETSFITGQAIPVEGGYTTQ